MTEREFDSKIQQIRDGFQLWYEFIQNSKLNKEDYILLFPHCEDPINEVGLKYLKLFISIKKPHKVIIFCQSKKVYEQIRKDAVNYYIEVRLMNKKEIEDLLTCYSAVNLSSHFIVMSLMEPFGRYGEKVIKRNGVEIEKVVLFGIYGLNREEVKNEI